MANGQKVSIYLPAEVAAAAKLSADLEKRSFSEYVAEALKEAVSHD